MSSVLKNRKIMMRKEREVEKSNKGIIIPRERKEKDGREDLQL